MTHSNWNCPQCHHQNISGDLIKCPVCGKKRNRWGYWDCRYCDTKQIRADHKECPNCGKAKDRDVKFYLHDDSPVEFVDEVSGESAVRIRKQNWICPYCSQQNDDSVQTCTYCGAQRSESQERYHDIPAPQEQLNLSKKAAKALAERKQQSKQRACCLVIALIFLIPILIGIVQHIMEASAEKRIRTAELISAEWESEIRLEKLTTFEDSDWELPSYARLIRTAQEDYQYIDHYESRTREVWIDEPDDNDWGGDDDWDDGGGWDDGGWEDYGDGQFGMFQIPVLMLRPALPMAAFYWETEYYEEPIYATRKETKYYYEYDQWVDGRTLRLQGGADEPPHYAEFSPSDYERERFRTIYYYVTFEDRGKTIREQCSESQFYEYIKDKTVTYRIKKAYSTPDYRMLDPE